MCANLEDVERVHLAPSDWHAQTMLLQECWFPRFLETACPSFGSVWSSCAFRWREALGLRDRMLAEGIKLDGYSFNALIEACSKGGQVRFCLSPRKARCTGNMDARSRQQYYGDISKIGTYHDLPKYVRNCYKRLISTRMSTLCRHRKGRLSLPAERWS